VDLHIELTDDGPLRSQLEHQLRDGIRSGRLNPDARLPPTRGLAAELGVSRGVVLEAYSQLVAEGYLVGRRGSGTRVASAVSGRPAGERRLPPPERAVRYEMRTGLCDVALFPRRMWQAASAQALRELPDPWLRYGRPRGFSRLRVALSEYLGRARSAVADPHHILVCAGLSHGLLLALRALREQGARRVAVEDPAWRRHPECATLAGLEPVPVRVDDGGLDVAGLARSGVDAVLLSPAHQYPTGVVLSPERRGSLIEWARCTGGTIVEDDYDAEYRYDRPPVASIQGLAPDVVLYAGTVSKTLAPGLRLAWLLAPSNLVGAVTEQQEAMGAAPPVLEQAALAVLMERGDFERHLRQTRRQYRSRRDVLVKALADRLPEVRVGGIAAGLHAVAWLPRGAREAEIADRALRHGLAIDTIHRDCAVSSPTPPGLLLGYGALGEEALLKAVSILAEAYAGAEVAPTRT
jgi:GntR family transcriptional regulator / MocR family aminotransferase